MKASTVRVSIDGRAFDIAADSSVAAAVAQSTLCFRRSVDGEPRAPLCGMGVCFECRLRIDGVDHLRSCMVAARDDMQIETDV